MQGSGDELASTVETAASVSSSGLVPYEPVTIATTVSVRGSRGRGNFASGSLRSGSRSSIINGGGSGEDGELNRIIFAMIEELSLLGRHVSLMGTEVGRGCTRGKRGAGCV